jgi:hypothetical protein
LEPVRLPLKEVRCVLFKGSSCREVDIAGTDQLQVIAARLAAHRVRHCSVSKYDPKTGVLTLTASR